MMIPHVLCLLGLLFSLVESRHRRLPRHRVTILGSSPSESFKMDPRHLISLQAGSPLNLTCLVWTEDIGRELHLTWHVLGYRKGIQHQKGFNKLTILFDEVDMDHTGEYQCMAKGIWNLDKGEETLSQKVRLNVLKNEGNCSRGTFSCTPGQCISSLKVCDGLMDCPDGSDEDLRQCGPDPCETKLHCADGRCIDTKLCCNPDFDEDCTHVPKCCKALIEFHRNFNNMDMKFLQISDDDSYFHSTILSVIACSTVFLIVFGFIFAIGIYHSRNSWVRQFRRHQHQPPGVRNTYYISNRVQTLERPPIHRPPSYRAIFGSDDPPPPYTEELSSEHLAFDLNNNGRRDANIDFDNNLESRMREDLLNASHHRGSGGSSSECTN